MEEYTSGAPASRVSGIIDLRRYDRENRRRLMTGFVVAAWALGTLAVLCPPLFRETPRPKEESYRTIIMDIVELPALPPAGPFVSRPSIHPPRPLRRPGFFPARPRGAPGWTAPGIPDIDAPRPDRDAGREAEEIARGFDGSLDVDAGVPRGPDGRIPLRRDTGPDPGPFRAEIVWNPEDRTATQGYVHIPLIRFAEPETPQTEKYIRSLRGLTAAINRHTNITAVLDAPLAPIKFYDGPNFMQIKEAPSEHGISLDSLFEFRPPLVYLLFDRKPFLNEAERGSLLRYVRGGGFLVVENARPGNEGLRNELRGFLSGVLGSAPMEPIPRGHPLYHCFFDFADTPEGAGQELGAIDFRVQPHLEGVWIRDTLVAVFSDRGYGLCWASEKKYEEQAKMGVNLVLYGLVRQRERGVPQMAGGR